MIEVNHLVKKYGNHYALNDLDFTVEEGKIYGLLGPNGAGKSTCMNIMTGYIAATEGNVVINGHDIVKDAEMAKKSIGYLPEIPPLYPDMKVREYLQFVAELKRVKKENRDKEIESVMKKTFIFDMQNRLIKNLSKGYKQRVGLAQAMIGNPDIIILDEPTVGLDPKQILEIRELILELKKEHTVILSSHILSEVSAICDEIMIISKGQMVACDTPEGLRHLMRGEDSLELEVRGEETTVRKALDTLEGIENYEIKENAASEMTFVTVTQTKGCDVREELFYALADAKCPIYKLERNCKTLEDIFLELTSAEPTQENKNDMMQATKSVMMQETKTEAGVDCAAEETIASEKEEE